MPVPPFGGEAMSMSARTPTGYRKGYTTKEPAMTARIMRPSSLHATRMLVLVLFLLTAVTNPAFALPRDPIDPPDIGEPDPVDPPQHGFDWRVPSRFGNGSVNYHWDS